MICPVELAHEMSAWRAVRVGDHAKHGVLLEGRDGAGNASAGGDGERRSHGGRSGSVLVWNRERAASRWSSPSVEMNPVTRRCSIPRLAISLKLLSRGSSKARTRRVG